MAGLIKDLRVKDLPVTDLQARGRRDQPGCRLTGEGLRRRVVVVCRWAVWGEETRAVGLIALAGPVRSRTANSVAVSFVRGCSVATVAVACTILVSLSYSG